MNIVVRSEGTKFTFKGNISFNVTGDDRLFIYDDDHKGIIAVFRDWASVTQVEEEK